MSETTRPNYYGAICGVDSIRIMEQFNFNFGNAMKYIWRCGKKPGVNPVEDLQKAVQYLEFEMERLQRPQPPSPKASYTRDADEDEED